MEKIKTRICDLTDWFVNIQTTKSIEYNEAEIVLETHAVSYENSPSNRERFQSEQAEHPQIIEAVFAIWGDEPTREDAKPKPPKKSKIETEEHEDV